MKKLLLIILLFSLSGCGNTVDLSAASDISATALSSKYALATEIKSKYQLDRVALKKTEIKNAELDKYKGEPKDEVQVIIGDKVLVGNLGATTEFKPNIGLKRWNEVGFKLKTDKLLADVATKDKKLSFDKDKIKFDTPKMSFEMYDYMEGEGGYKYIWYLNEKPLTNKIEFEIESSGLDFFYQPPLTEEFQNGYCEEFQKEIVVTETQVKDLEGNILVERPENAVGSYAVYHSTKGGMNDIYGKDYKVGKAFHIYRPHIIDASGVKTWGILHIENGKYSVEIPQEFLDNAVYPIKSNDTFGYGAGNTSVTPTSDRFYNSGIEYSVSFNGTINSITGKVGMAGGAYDWQGAIYNDTSRIDYISSSDTNASVVSVYTVSVVGGNSVISGLDYYVAIALDNTPGNIYYDAGDNYMKYASYTWGSPPDPITWTTSETNKRKFYVYATYTPSAPPAAATNPQQIIIFD